MRHRIDHPCKCQLTAIRITTAQTTIVQPPIAKAGSQNERGHIIIIIKKPEVRVLHQVRRISLPYGLGLVLSRSLKYPAHVRPPKTMVTRAVRIFVRVGKGVMQTVRRNPCDRPRLQTERAARRQETHHPFRRRKTAMRQKTMISNADTPTRGDPPADECGQCILPAECKKSRDCHDVKQCHENYRVPI